MEIEMMKRMVEEGCPFAQRSRMRVVERSGDDRFSMILEEDPANYNAFGLVHAGAICGLVETAGGMAIFSHLDPREFVVLNTVLNIRFVAMPRGELRCTARFTSDEARALLDDFNTGGKADKTIDARVTDSEGKTVAQAQATFRLMETPEQFKEYFAAMA